MIIKVPEVTWSLGDPEQSTASGVTVTTRPIYYKGTRAGSIHRDYSERLMTQLLSAQPSPSVADSRTWFDMLAHLQRQREWSGRTFGPGARTTGVVDHIRKELREIEADPSDVSEWVDVVILALDGAWRAGYQPQQIIDALVAKQAKNERREWPDWRTAPADKAIEHVKASAPSPSAPAHPNTETQKETK